MTDGPPGEVPGEVLYGGVSVDVTFPPDRRPTFGDLFLICGLGPHPRFPPTARGPDFAALADLQFAQVDDAFGVPTLAPPGEEQEGDETAVWLLPLVGGEPVDHHPGPFDGVRLEYCVLRHPPRRADHFFHCVRRFAELGGAVTYRGRDAELGVPPDLGSVRADVAAAVRRWRARGVEPGSDAALRVDF